MAKLTVLHKWVGLGRVQSFMLILGRVGLGHFTCGSGQENWTHVQLWIDYKQTEAAEENNIILGCAQIAQTSAKAFNLNRK